MLGNVHCIKSCGLEEGFSLSRCAKPSTEMSKINLEFQWKVFGVYARERVTTPAGTPGGLGKPLGLFSE